MLQRPRAGAVGRRLRASRTGSRCRAPFPDIYRTARVERVAPFFQALQAELVRLNRQDDARICLLTPGPMNETYFEHAYLARYLGLLLVEGEDLIVRDDGVFIRTVSGLQRTEVLLRRIDADFADPLELNAALAARRPRPVAGGARRQGRASSMRSAPAWSRRARMLAFLPALAPIVLGADLAMPNIATWWLGRADMREEMIGKLDSMVIASAFTDRRSTGVSGSEILGAKLDARAARGAAAVDPRPRRRLCRAGSGDAVEHAGLARRRAAAAAVHAAAVSRQGRRALAASCRAASCASPTHAMRAPSACSAARRPPTPGCWRTGRWPRPRCCRPPERMQVQRATGLLPSRAADNLFWVGRYVERAEATLRLIRAMINRVAEADDAAAPVIASIGALLRRLGRAVPADTSAAPPAVHRARRA